MSIMPQASEQETPFYVSFIIPALNEAVMLRRLLNSINTLERASDIDVHEIIVVDANSSDGTAELARANGCIVVSAKPGFVATSRNLGAAKASGTVLAFVDADCELPSNWLIAVVQELRKPGVVAAGSRLASSQLDNTWVEKAWFALAYSQQISDKSSNVSWLATFNIAIRKSTFEQVDGFDNSLTTCEDVEFGYKLSSMGTLRRVDYCGVIHYGESKTIGEFYRREAWRSRGSIEILGRYWRDPRELISFLLPIIFVVGTLSSFLLTVYCLVQLYLGELGIGMIATLAFLVGPVPIILLTLQRKAPWRMFAHCMLLICIYFFARFHGMLHPFKRVERVES